MIDSGNTTWLLVSSALVMLMTPGLAFFYAGMVSRKNVVSTLLQNYVSLALVGIIWVVVGYSLVFTEGNGLIGSFDKMLLSGLTSEIMSGPNVPMLAFVLFQMMFAIITPALITGSFAERVNFKAWIIMLASWSLLVYVPVAHWVWGPGGWIAADGGLDFAGGLVVHMTAGSAGLICGFLFKGRKMEGSHMPNDVPMIMLGVALLWFGWFGFNAGSALTSGALAAHAFLLTLLGGAVAFVAWLAVDWIRLGRPTATGSAIGIVVGLVTITPAAGYVSIESAIIMCTISGVVCNLIASYVRKMNHVLDDALDVFACHGIGAIIGSILTGAFASKAVNPSIAVEGILISGETSLFYANLMATVVVFAYTCLMTFIIIKVIGLFTPIRVTESEEEEGLDTTHHGEFAKYNKVATRKKAPRA